MAVVVTEVVEDGIPYRITEDEEIGFYLKESMMEPPISPEKTLQEKVDLLETEKAALEDRLAVAEDAILALMDMI